MNLAETAKQMNLAEAAKQIAEAYRDSNIGEAYRLRTQRDQGSLDLDDLIEAVYSQGVLHGRDTEPVNRRMPETRIAHIEEYFNDDDVRLSRHERALITELLVAAENTPTPAVVESDDNAILLACKTFIVATCGERRTIAKMLRGLAEHGLGGATRHTAAEVARLIEAIDDTEVPF